MRDVRNDDELLRGVSAGLSLCKASVVPERKPMHDNDLHISQAGPTGSRATGVDQIFTLSATAADELYIGGRGI
jgi:hypothetical protein